MKDKRLVGEFSQAAARSSAAILGVALSNNIYGNPAHGADDGSFCRSFFQCLRCPDFAVFAPCG